MQTIDYFNPTGDSLEIEVINAKDATVQSYWKDDNMSTMQWFSRPEDEIEFFANTLNDTGLFHIQKQLDSKS